MIPTPSPRPLIARLAVTPAYYDPDSFVPLLECSYGSYSHRANPTGSGMPRNRPICHNPIERPQDRHHCSDCGGDYCSVHADRAAHDCASVMG